MLDKRGRAKALRMKTFAFERVAGRCLICFVLALTVTTIECLPLFETATAPSTSSSTSPYVEDLLRLYNISNEDVEASRQKQIATRHFGSVNHRHFPPATRQQQQKQHLSSLHLHSEATSPASSLDAQIIIHQRNRSNVTVNMSTRSAFQRKQEVIRNVLGFVNENGRPQMPFPSGGLPLGIGPIPPFFPPFSRPDATADLYERTRYIQPSCETPKHADEELWSAGTTLPLSLHLFFNLSGIQSQTRSGYQLYVTGAKLRLFKFVEGEAIPSAPLPTESADANLATGSMMESPIQTLKAVPFFDPPLHPSYEEKIRVSVHNYTRPLKRNRVQKKKLLDSQMALAKEESYMKLDIKLAARWWLATGGRNFGLTIEIEDTDGQRKPITEFFRPRNCSPDNSGSTRSDELTDPANVASPVLELTLIEMPEGKSVFEVPSNTARVRNDETESVASEDVDTFTELMDESSSRRHRHQHSAHVAHTSQEEQADEAVLHVNNHSLKSGVPFNPIVPQVGKHRILHPYASRLGHSQTFNYRPTASPVPTLATLEDHDLIRDSDDEETMRTDIDGTRLQLRNTNLFMQRMMQHQQNQQHHSNSKPTHHLRAKDNKKQ